MIFIVCHPPMSSAAGARFVSCLLPRRQPPRQPFPVFLIQNPELILGPMEQNPEIIAVHAKLAADLILILFLEKEGAKQVAVLFGQLFDDLADPVLHLPGNKQTFRIHRMIRQFQIGVIPWAGLRGSPVKLLDDVVANPVDERAKPLRLPHSILTQGNQYPYIGLLAEVLYRFRGEHPRSQFDPEKLVKVGDKMLFRRGSTLAEALHVFPGECEEFHVALGLVAEEYSRANNG